MRKYSPENERIKRRYFAYLKEAKRHSDPTVDAAAKALHRFEEYTKYKDFRVFHTEQAIAFKKHLAEQKAEQSGEKLSKATLLCHSDAAQALLPVVGLAAWLQVAISILRCRVFQSVRERYADCHSPTGTKGTDVGADQACHPCDACQHGDRPAQPSTDCLHAAYGRQGQCHRLDEVEAC